MKGGYLPQDVSDVGMIYVSANWNSRRGVKVLHDLAMCILRGRNPIDQGSGTDQWISCSEVHDEPRDQLGLVGVRERGPRRARIRAVDRHFAHAFAVGGGG